MARYFISLILAAAAYTHAGEIEGCQVFPADNPWNQDISKLPVHPRSANYMSTILSGNNKFLHADFGSYLGYGIPFNVVTASQEKVPIKVLEYPEESDPGPFPIPLDASVEGDDPDSGDRHVCVIDKDNGVLYELYHAVQTADGWECGSSAKFDLKSNALRSDGWTSCDEAGLPIFPGLARIDEVTVGEINHALRVTVHATQKAFIHPATHRGQNVGPDFPPMGLRLRLRADFDLTPFTGQSRVILTALKKYGLIVADTGSDWFVTGASDFDWDDDDLNQLKTVPGSAFEAVDTGPILGVDTTGGSDGGDGGDGGGTVVPHDSFDDSDADGFPDELEIAVGSDPDDGDSTPMNISPDAFDTLNTPKLKVGLDFRRAGSDSISFSGSINLPPGTAIGGQTIIIDVGGAIKTFTLNSGGKGLNGFNSVSVKPGKNGAAKVQARLRGSFSSVLSDEGFTQDNGGSDLDVDVLVLFGGMTYTEAVTAAFKVKNGKGAAKSLKPDF